MTDTQSLGERMKRYEVATRVLLPLKTHTILRVDGRAFHSYLRGAQKPYDAQFANDMGHVAKALCEEITGAVFAYCQSDEISVLFTDTKKPGTEPWFGGVAAKQISMAAAVATYALNQCRPGKRALFDARVFTVADSAEVANYFIWRQRDAVRNSISMAAQAYFSHRELQGVTSAEMQDMLFTKHGVNWNDYPDEQKRGQVTVRESGLTNVSYVDKRTGSQVETEAIRSWWETKPAPHFTSKSDGWLATANLKEE